MNNAEMYHYQADVDKYAKQDDNAGIVPSVSIKQILEAYYELLDDLLLESQEAY